MLKHKPVSRCRGDKCSAQRYNPVPKEKEFGIGQYHCPRCNRFFFAHCEFTDILDCRKCKQPCTNPVIHPKWRKRRRPQNSGRRLLNPNAQPFHPRTRTGDTGQQPVQFTATRTIYSERGMNGKSFRHSGEPQPGKGFRFTPSAGTGYMTGGPPSHSWYRTECFERETRTGPRRLSLPQRCKRKHVFNPSTPHQSTGSTISTFLSQDDHQSECDLDYDDDIDDDSPYPRRFVCRGCGSKYTVRCKMRNTALCYACNTDNSPLGPASAEEIDRMTSKEHSCSECPKSGIGNCPNLPYSKND